jgi:DNA-binding NarL/FixJ family response regulator
MNIIAPLIKLGIKGIILKNTSTTDVITAMREVLMGRTYYSQEIIANITKSMNNSIQFTKREIEIIRLLKEALTTKEIAEKLFLSTHTVESHRKNILAKTQCTNRQALLNYIDNNNII